jgi:hypothetical protein
MGLLLLSTVVVVFQYFNYVSWQLILALSQVDLTEEVNAMQDSKRQVSDEYLGG